jgi:hypothetical protein
MPFASSDCPLVMDDAHEKPFVSAFVEHKPKAGPIHAAPFRITPLELRIWLASSERYRLSRLHVRVFVKDEAHRGQGH